MPKTAARKRGRTNAAKPAGTNVATLEAPRDAAPEDDPLFLPALLKVALELRRGRLPSAAFDDVVDGVVSGMGLDHDAFGRFVSNYRDELIARARELASLRTR